MGYTNTPGNSDQDTADTWLTREERARDRREWSSKHFLLPGEIYLMMPERRSELARYKACLWPKQGPSQI